MNETRKYIIPENTEIYINDVLLSADHDTLIILPINVADLIEDARRKSFLLLEPKYISSDFQGTVISVNPLELISVH